MGVSAVYVLTSWCVAGGAAGMLGLTPDQDPAKDGVPLDPPPSTRQGFGRMQLTSSVPLAPSGPFRMQVRACRRMLQHCQQPHFSPHLYLHPSPALPGHVRGRCNKLAVAEFATISTASCGKSCSSLAGCGKAHCRYLGIFLFLRLPPLAMGHCMCVYLATLMTSKMCCR